MVPATLLERQQNAQLGSAASRSGAATDAPAWPMANDRDRLATGSSKLGSLEVEGQHGLVVVVTLVGADRAERPAM